FLSNGECTLDCARARSRSSAVSQQGDRDSVMLTALINGRVMLDSGVVEGRCVLLQADRIVDVVRDTDPRCRDARRRDLGGMLLLPGFIDTQVNGGGGVLFN